MWALEWLECTYRKCGSFINGAGGEEKWERDKLGTCVSLKSFLTTGWDPPPKKIKGSSFVKLIFETPPDSRWHRVRVEIYVEIKLSLAYIILSQRNCVIVISGASGTRLAVYLFLPCISSKLWWQQERKWSSFSPTQRKKVFFFSFLLQLYRSAVKKNLGGKRENKFSFPLQFGFHPSSSTMSPVLGKVNSFSPFTRMFKTWLLAFLFLFYRHFLNFDSWFPPFAKRREKRKKKKLDVQVEGYDAVR